MGGVSLHLKRRTSEGGWFPIRQYDNIPDIGWLTYRSLTR